MSDNTKPAGFFSKLFKKISTGAKSIPLLFGIGTYASRLHIMLVGVSGVGKTRLIDSWAEASSGDKDGNGNAPPEVPGKVSIQRRIEKDPAGTAKYTEIEGDLDGGELVIHDFVGGQIGESMLGGSYPELEEAAELAHIVIFVIEPKDVFGNQEESKQIINNFAGFARSICKNRATPPIFYIVYSKCDEYGVPRNDVPIRAIRSRPQRTSLIKISRESAEAWDNFSTSVGSHPLVRQLINATKSLWEAVSRSSFANGYFISGNPHCSLYEDWHDRGVLQVLSDGLQSVKARKTHNRIRPWVLLGGLLFSVLLALIAWDFSGSASSIAQAKRAYETTSGELNHDRYNSVATMIDSAPDTWLHADYVGRQLILRSIERQYDKLAKDLERLAREGEKEGGIAVYGQKQFEDGENEADSKGGKRPSERLVGPLGKDHFLTTREKSLLGFAESSNTDKEVAGWVQRFNSDRERIRLMAEKLVEFRNKASRVDGEAYVELFRKTFDTIEGELNVGFRAKVGGRSLETLLKKCLLRDVNMLMHKTFVLKHVEALRQTDTPPAKAEFLYKKYNPYTLEGLRELGLTRSIVAGQLDTGDQVAIKFLAPSVRKHATTVKVALNENGWDSNFHFSISAPPKKRLRGELHLQQGTDRIIIDLKHVTISVNGREPIPVSEYPVLGTCEFVKLVTPKAEKPITLRYHRISHPLPLLATVLSGVKKGDKALRVYPENADVQYLKDALAYFDWETPGWRNPFHGTELALLSMVLEERLQKQNQLLQLLNLDLGAELTRVAGDRDSYRMRSVAFLAELCLHEWEEKLETVRRNLGISIRPGKDFVTFQWSDAGTDHTVKVSSAVPPKEIVAGNKTLAWIDYVGDEKSAKIEYFVTEYGLFFDAQKKMKDAKEKGSVALNWQVGQISSSEFNQFAWPSAKEELLLNMKLESWRQSVHRYMYWLNKKRGTYDPSISAACRAAIETLTQRKDLHFAQRHVLKILERIKKDTTPVAPKTMGVHWRAAQLLDQADKLQIEFAGLKTRYGYQTENAWRLWRNALAVRLKVLSSQDDFVVTRPPEPTSESYAKEAIAEFRKGEAKLTEPLKALPHFFRVAFYYDHPSTFEWSRKALAHMKTIYQEMGYPYGVRYVEQEISRRSKLVQVDK